MCLGSRQDPGSLYSAVIPLFMTRILNGQSPIIYGDGLQSRDFTYVDNVVDAILLAADAENVNGQTVNIASGKSYSLLTLVEVLSEQLQQQVTPTHEPPRTGNIKDSLADITKARELLNYEPTIGLEEGLRRTVDYYRGER